MFALEFQNHRLNVCHNFSLELGVTLILQTIC